MSTIVTYIGNGTQTDFQFDFEYLKREFVTVFVGDNARAFDFFTPYTVRITPAPAADAVVVIQRKTDTDRLVTFVDGSILTDGDLNLANIQAVHIAEEARDGTAGVAEDARTANIAAARALDAAQRADLSADAAELYDGIWFNTAAVLADNTTLTYAAGGGANTVAVGNFVLTRTGQVFRVAGAAAAGTHLQTAGGVRLWEGGTQFTTRARAAQSVARGEHTTGGTLTVTGRRYEVDPLGPDGLVAIDFDFSGAKDRLSARMMDGLPVRFAAFGDSTTDGNGTTDWTENPVNPDGSAVGSAAHTPVNAWPAVAQGIMRDMFKNTAIDVWNAGYGGKWLITGWARNNYARAVINNPAYGTPDAVFLNFGLNDVTSETYSDATLSVELRLMFSLIEFHGGVPILVTPDPATQPGVRQVSNVSRYITTLKKMADLHGIPLLDSATAITEAVASAGSNGRWVSFQPDTLHGGDAWHRIKGGFIAASMFPNTLWLDEAGEAPVNIAPWAKEANGSALSGSIFKLANNTFGGSFNVNVDSYALGATLLDIYVWNTKPGKTAWWHSVDNDGLYDRPEAEIGTVALTRYISNAASSSPAARPLRPVGSPGRRASDTPTPVATLSPGLNRVRYIAQSAGTRPPIYLGFFSFRKAVSTARFATFIPPTGSGMAMYDDDPWGFGDLVVGSTHLRTSEMVFEVSLPDAAGAVLMAGRVFGGDSDYALTNSRRGLMLFRGAGNVSLYDVLFSNSEVSLVGAAKGSAAYTFTGRDRFRLRSSVSTAGLQTINLFDGWETNTALISVTADAATEALPFGGRPGPFFKNFATAGAGVASLDIYSMK